ncbi:acyl carrier protein [Streptomyces sp. NBC_00564]|uniref:acyl carrier protein n=1 Tax=Streptomyces sp. NBC_00564 TaxID=2903663 RepID=UPI00352C2EB6|nr:phosphopantetheine-binding protein [Streptomyces sp. NBC_00564]
MYTEVRLHPPLEKKLSAEGDVGDYAAVQAQHEGELVLIVASNRLTPLDVRRLLGDAGTATVPDAYAVVPALEREKSESLALGWAEKLLTGRPLYRLCPPETEVQRLLIEVWERSLGIDGIGIDDDFIELGGDSVAAVEILTETEKRVGTEVGVDELFECGTVRELSSRIEGKAGSGDA